MQIPQLNSVLLTAGKKAWVVRDVSPDVFVPDESVIELEAAVACDGLVPETLLIKSAEWSGWCEANRVTCSDDVFAASVRPTAQKALWAWQQILSGGRAAPGWSDSQL